MPDKDKKRDPASGTAIYEAEKAALLARTEKLRALRLAREAEAAANAPEPAAKAARTPPAQSRKARAAKSKEPKKKLSDWMKSQQDGGHRS